MRSFIPNSKGRAFCKRGIGLNLRIADNPNTPLEHKGIVFNEMKGALSSADARLWHEMLALLVPDLPYAHNSGGDPKEIPSLTYPELLSFHQTYYHPSRCLFFFYGNFPLLKKHLDFIADKGLKHVEKLPPLLPVKKQARMTTPLHKEIHYPVSEEEESPERTMISFGWLTASLFNAEEVLALTVLDAILMETDASLLKRALLQSKLCIHADAYLDNEMTEIPYVIVPKDIKRKISTRSRHFSKPLSKRL